MNTAELLNWIDEVTALWCGNVLDSHAGKFSHEDWCCDLRALVGCGAGGLRNRSLILPYGVGWFSAAALLAIGEAPVLTALPIAACF
jgi:hypothetical protein